MTTTQSTDRINPVHLSAPGSSAAEPYRGKRAFDLLAAGTACLVFGPLATAISLATVIEDGGPALPQFVNVWRGDMRIRRIFKLAR
jgi:lipopolysaccharide/colanic/teichoic acid biosynthesis glycosyltransferase